MDPLPELGILEDKNELFAADSDSSCDLPPEVDDSLVLENPLLVFEASLACLPFKEELKDWFSSSDIRAVPLITQLVDSSPNLEKWTQLCKDSGVARDRSDANDHVLLKALTNLTHFALGQFGNDEEKFANENQLVNKIQDNISLLSETQHLVSTLAAIIISNGDSLSQNNVTPAKLDIYSLQLFYSMTILNIIVLNFITSEDTSSQRDLLKENLAESGILPSLVKSVSQWHLLKSKFDTKSPKLILEIINSNTDEKNKLDKYSLKLINSFKVRNVLQLINNLILLLFGNSTHLQSTKEFLDMKFEMNENAGTISSIDYQYFKNDLLIRYPTYIPPSVPLSNIVQMTILEAQYKDQKESQLQPDEDEETDDDVSDTESISSILKLNSLSINQHQHLKSKHINGISLTSNSPPDVHIATPMPSPTLTPQHTGSSSPNTCVSELKSYQQMQLNNGGEKKKLYITQSNFPNVYPINTNGEPPKSIKQAISIFQNNINDDLSLKQFLENLENFIKHENNLRDSYEDEFNMDFTIGKDPLFANEIKSLRNVENFYSECLPYLNDFIEVIIQILASNIHPNTLKNQQQQQQHNTNNNSAGEKKGLNAPLPTSFNKLKLIQEQKLEHDRLLQTMLRSSLSIVSNLQQWLKIVHIVKNDYLNSLLYDNDFLAMGLAVLDGIKMNHDINFDEDQTADGLKWYDGGVEGGLNQDGQLDYELLSNKLIFNEFDLSYQNSKYNIIKKLLEINNPNADKEIEINGQGLDNCFNSVLNEDNFSIKNKSNDSPKLTFLPPNGMLFAGAAAGNGEHHHGFVHTIQPIKITRPNLRNCFISSLILKSILDIISNFKLHRIYQLIDMKPTEILRNFLNFHNENFYQSILKIIKEISPFMGKKWRINNMELISMVYLFDKIGLKDIWLDNLLPLNLNDRIKMGVDNENTLRNLIQFYNKIKYNHLVNSVEVDLDSEFSNHF